MKKKTESSISDQLRERIEESDLSLRELGRLAGIDVSQLSRFINEQRDLTLAAAGRLCHVLGLQFSAAKPTKDEDTLDHKRSAVDTKHDRHQ